MFTIDSPEIIDLSKLHATETIILLPIFIVLTCKSHWSICNKFAINLQGWPWLEYM